MIEINRKINLQGINLETNIALTKEEIFMCYNAVNNELLLSEAKQEVEKFINKNNDKLTIGDIKALSESLTSYEKVVDTFQKIKNPDKSIHDTWIDAINIILKGEQNIETNNEIIKQETIFNTDNSSGSEWEPDKVSFNRGYS